MEPAALATENAAATAIGLTGLFGYLGTVLSGWGLSKRVHWRDWDAGIAGLMIVAAIGTLLRTAAWGAKTDGCQS
jgi:sugar phosphate permease